MGNCFSLFYWFEKEDKNENYQYAVFDPTQISKPEGRTKDLISSKHKN